MALGTLSEMRFRMSSFARLKGICRGGQTLHFVQRIVSTLFFNTHCGGFARLHFPCYNGARFVSLWHAASLVARCVPRELSFSGLYLLLVKRLLSAKPGNAWWMGRIDVGTGDNYGHADMNLVMGGLHQPCWK